MATAFDFSTICVPFTVDCKSDMKLVILLFKMFVLIYLTRAADIDEAVSVICQCVPVSITSVKTPWARCGESILITKRL